MQRDPGQPACCTAAGKSSSSNWGTNKNRPATWVAKQRPGRNEHSWTSVTGGDFGAIAGQPSGPTPLARPGQALPLEGAEQVGLADRLAALVQARLDVGQG
jgi:hypothetical protein